MDSCNNLIELAQVDTTENIEINSATIPANDENIVDTFGRVSISTNPFDAMEMRARLYGDPFEMVNLSETPQCNRTVPTGSLIQIDCNDIVTTNATDVSKDNIKTSYSDGSVSRRVTDSVNDSLLGLSRDSPHRHRITPYDILMKKMRRNSESTNDSLSDKCKTQLCSMSPKTIDSKNSVIQLLTNTCLIKESNNCSVTDDLMSTNPEWIDSFVDSDNEDKDFERLTIPCLKNIPDRSIIIENDIDMVDDRKDIVDKLAQYKNTCTAENNEVSVEHVEKSSDAFSLIETLRKVVNDSKDETSKVKATALLDNLNVCINNQIQNNFTTPKKASIVRQGTFSIGKGRQSVLSTGPKPSSRKSCSPILKKRASRSLSDSEEPVPSVSNSKTSINSRRLSVDVGVKTPTRTVSQATPRKDTFSRKSIFKTSDSLLRPNHTTGNTLKLRVVGDQKKSGGPLKAIVPIRRASILKNIEVISEVKKTFSTSTPSANSRQSLACGANNINRPSIQLSRIGNRSNIPVTPKAAIKSQLPTPQRRRTVSFDNDAASSKTMSTPKQLFTMMSPTRKRLSQSFLNNKEN